MREIQASTITSTVSRPFQDANFNLGADVLSAIEKALHFEESDLAKNVLRQILENAKISKNEGIPLCQDCGTAIVFLEVGQELHIAGGDLGKAVEEGVRQGYREGCLRKSIVRQPFSDRVNTGDNTPCVIHTEIVPGDKLKITVMPKGGGAENMSRLMMLAPGEGRSGVVKGVVSAVSEAGANPCPPVIVGVGVAPTSEQAMLLAKKALLRPVGQPSPDPEVAGLEHEILRWVNDLGIGPMGFGGRTTALAVHADVMPVHIASLPLAVNLQCHSCRHKEAVL